MKGCLLFVVAMGLGFAVGVVVILALIAVTGDEDLSSIIGTGVWLLSTFTILAYGSLWLSDPEDFKHPLGGRRDSKMQTAEIRMAFVFAMVGGALAWHAKGPMVLTVLIGTACAVLGGLIGYDLKRRVRQIRVELHELERLTAAAETPKSPSGDESPHSST